MIGTDARSRWKKGIVINSLIAIGQCRLLIDSLFNLRNKLSAESFDILHGHLFEAHGQELLQLVTNLRLKFLGAADDGLVHRHIASKLQDHLGTTHERLTVMSALSKPRLHIFGKFIVYHSNKKKKGRSAQSLS